MTAFVTQSSLAERKNVFKHSFYMKTNTCSTFMAKLRSARLSQMFY